MKMSNISMVCELLARTHNFTQLPFQTIVNFYLCLVHSDRNYRHTLLEVYEKKKKWQIPTVYKHS